MRILTVVARTLLGLAFLIIGANYFLRFLPAPSHGPTATGFLAALVAGRVLAVVKVIEIGAGLALLANRFVPLALTVLAPVLVAINLFHAVFEPSGLPLTVALVGLELWLAWSYRDAFRPVLQAVVTPRPPVAGRVSTDRAPVERRPLGA